MAKEYRQVQSSTYSDIITGSSSNFREEDHPRDDEGKFVNKGDATAKQDALDKKIDKFANTMGNELKPYRFGTRAYFDKEYEIYSKYQNGTATKDNFFMNSIAFFEATKRPRRKPDYVSYTRDGKVSSEYWYNGDTLIRGSSHWGYGIASCDWALDGTQIRDELVHTYKLYGEVKFENIKFKTGVIKVNGKEHLVGFNNVIEYKTGRLPKRVFEINGEAYINEGEYTFYEYVKANYNETYGTYFPDYKEVEKIRTIKSK